MRLFSNLLTCRIGCEVGPDFYERAERLREPRSLRSLENYSATKPIPLAFVIP